MPAPGTWPREAPRPTDSHAERAVWQALRAGLPKGWYAWHSLRIRDARNVDGEGDFVIAAPARGLLVLEVKGGHVELRDGRWLQNGREMRDAPRDQANRCVRKLVARLRDDGCAPPAYGVATCFPDLAFDRGPGAGDLAGLVLGADDLRWLERALPELLERALPPAGREQGRWIDALHRLWGESWTPTMRLGARVRLDEERRTQLDARQLELLDLVADNERMLIEGGAGTGKTLLACESARRFARGGRRVLLLCFTDPLSRWIRAHVDDRAVDVTSVRKLAHELARAAGQPLDETADDFWEDLPWRAAEAVELLGRRWDAVVVDEAQDFTLGDWALVEKCAGGRALWAYHDPHQAFWPDREIPRDLFQAHFSLKDGYRCPPELRLVAEAYAGRPLDRDALDAAVAKGQLAVVACPSESSVPDKVAVEIDKLLGEGLRPGDIAVVSLRGQTAPGAVARLDQVGRHRLVRADSEEAGEQVVADTFLRFKGLERAAIVVTDLRLVEDRREVRMYVAMTRALGAVRVVAPGGSLEADPVLGGIA